MNQLAFDIPGRRLPRARRSDGDGSHAAADRLERSGRAAQQLADVLAAVRAHPGLTSKQLAAVTDPPNDGDRRDWRYAIGRRLSELEPRYVRREKVTGEQARWWPK